VPVDTDDQARLTRTVPAAAWANIDYVTTLDGVRLPGAAGASDGAGPVGDMVVTSAFAGPVAHLATGAVL